MQIYLASRFSRRFEMQGHRAELQRVGHSITSRWIDEKADNERSSLRSAREDFTDVELADCLIAFGDVPRSTNSRGGHHVEFGLALALGKQTILVGHRENVFAWLPEVTFFETWPAALAELSNG